MTESAPVVASTLADAKSQIASLAEEAKTAWGYREGERVHAAIDALAALAEVNEADARRYRWLRDDAWNAPPPQESEDMVWCVVGPNGNKCMPIDGLGLDTAIDAALANQEKPE